MQRLLAAEHGLAWTSHPRIKGSSWTPDIFRHEDFYLSDRWLGAAWKAMPGGPLARPPGRRALDLLDDMANWGQQKYLPGEVDVFKIDHTHELYGHMNINYIRMDGDRLPRFEEGWQPVLDSLRAGRFFVTTGEVLIPEFTVNGQPQRLDRSPQAGRETGDQGRPRPGPSRCGSPKSSPVTARASSASGSTSRTPAHLTRRTLRLSPDLAGRKWVRVEAWDVAANGAFTQPVWLVSAKAD